MINSQKIRMEHNGAYHQPTSLNLNKKINEQVSDIGQNSINLPLGIVKITRPVKALDIIIRTCSNVNMLTQNKARLFEREKIEYTLRTIISIINSGNLRQ